MVSEKQADVDFTEEQAAAVLLGRAQRVCVLTGAGLSVDSGISTFRDDGGLWTRFPPEQFASLDGVQELMGSAPHRLAEFAHALTEPVASARPNPGHLAIRQLEQRGSVTVITQNVDGLHQDAGSTQVHEVHGSLLTVVDQEGRELRRVQRPQLAKVAAALKRVRPGPWAFRRLAAAARPLAGLTAEGIYRPSVVLFGESVLMAHWGAAQEAVRRCQVLLCVGTSGAVMPCAGLPDLARAAGALVVGVGPVDEGTAHIWLTGTASTVLPRLCSQALAA